MENLRWILLAAGVVLIAGVYLWGLRSRRRSAAPEPERAALFEPQAPTRPVAPAPRVDPEVGSVEGRHEAVEPVASFAAGPEEAPVVRPGAMLRREPVIGPGLEPAPSPPSRAEPAPPMSAEPRRPAPAQKIIAIRIVASEATPFEGRALREAVESAGLAFGRYQIFHRLDARGRPLFSLASLKEPGTFDPAAMDGATYRGVAMFLVLPGPVAGEQAFAEMMEAARAIAGRLRGLLQDERGTALAAARIGQLRDEVAGFDRAQATGG
jgi:cell division protein ZipA